MGGIVTSPDVFEFYRYVPSKEAAAVFVILFALSSTLHLYQLIRTRAWIVVPLVVGGISESIGYIGRILSSSQAPTYTMGAFLLQNMLTLLAPALFAATIYMCLGRLIQAVHGEALSPVSPKWMTFLFVTGDVAGLAIQGAGAGVMTSGGLQAFHNGEKVVIAGLALLAASFGLFVAIALVFDYRMRKTPTDRGSQLNWKRELIILYLASFLILLRSVFRLVEYSQGNKGYLITQEWTLFVFDSILMFAALVLFNVWHPSHVKALLDGGKYSQKCGMKYVDIQAEKSQFGDQEQMRGL